MCTIKHAIVITLICTLISTILQFPTLIKSWSSWIVTTNCRGGDYYGIDTNGFITTNLGFANSNAELLLGICDASFFPKVDAVCTMVGKTNDYHDNDINYLVLNMVAFILTFLGMFFTIYALRKLEDHSNSGTLHDPSYVWT